MYVAYKSGILCDKKNDCLKKRGRIKTSLKCLHQHCRVHAAYRPRDIFRFDSLLLVPEI